MEEMKNKEKMVKILKPSNSDTTMICLPFVGANWTAFTHLAKNLTEDIEIISINPPGHPGDENDPLTSVEQMADLYLELLEPWFHKKLILFGISLGGIVIHCMLKKLDRKRVFLEATVIIGASIPPHLVTEASNIAGFSDEQVISFFKTFGGIPDILKNERALLNFFLPIVKADYKAFSEYRPTIGLKLGYKAYIIYGNEDKFINRELILGWKEYFQEPPICIEMDAGHVFLKDDLFGTVDVLSSIMESDLYASNHSDEL